MKKPIHFYFLAVLVSFSVFELEIRLSSLLFLGISGLVVLIAKRRNVLIPPVAFVVVAYVLAFPLPALLPDLYPNLWTRVPPDALEHGMLWAVRGFGAFALGYVLVEQLAPRLKNPGSRGETLSNQRASYTIYMLTSIGWLAALAWVTSVMLFGISLTFIEGDPSGIDRGEGTLAQIFTLLSSLRYPFFLGFLILYYWKKTNQHLFYLFIGLLVISVIEIIVIGSKGSIIRGLMVGLLALAFLPIKLNLKQTIIGLLALLVVYGSFAVITEYRSIMQNELQSGRNVFDFTVQLEAFGAALVGSLPFAESAKNRQTEVDHTDILSRFGAGMFSFANLLEMTGGQPPYEYAWETFLVPIYSIAPRALMPDKPEFFHSGRNAREYYGWTYGGISVSLPGSFYFAWGYAGILCGMGFVGGLLAYVIRQAKTMGLYSPHWLIILPILLVPILDVGVTFQAITTNFIRVAVLLWLLHLFYPLVRGSRRRALRNGSPIEHGNRP